MHAHQQATRIPYVLVRSPWHVQKSCGYARAAEPVCDRLPTLPVPSGCSAKMQHSTAMATPMTTSWLSEGTATYRPDTADSTAGGRRGGGSGRRGVEGVGVRGAR